MADSRCLMAAYNEIYDNALRYLSDCLLMHAYSVLVFDSI